MIEKKRKKYTRQIDFKRVVVDMNKEIKEETISGDYKKYIKDRCFICGCKIKNSLKNYLVRGNCCDHCSGECQETVKRNQSLAKEEGLSYQERLEKENSKNSRTEVCIGDCINCSNYDCASNLNIKAK